MSLSDLASIGSFVSGASVFVSLVFLYFQLRKVNEQVTLNTKHTQALVWQGATDRAVSQVLQMANADLSAAYLMGNGDEATPEAIRQRQFELQVFAWFEISFAEMFQHGKTGWSGMRDGTESVLTFACFSGPSVERADFYRKEYEHSRARHIVTGITIS